MPEFVIARIHPEEGEDDGSLRELDVFFLHGLGGDCFETWRSTPEESWLKWLANEFPNFRIFTVAYDSAKLAGALEGQGTSIQDIAQLVCDSLITRDNPSPRCAFVAHSLGGLVVKQIALRCEASANSDYVSFGRTIAGIAFLGTPHQGSGAASAVDVLFSNFTSRQTKQLKYGDDALVDLNERFRSWASKYPVTINAYFETEKTYGVLIVDKVTANPGITGCEPTPVQSDHIDICKPSSQEAALYKSIKYFLKLCIKEKSDLSGSEESASIAPDILEDYEYYTQQAESDRRSLEEKLNDSGRGHSIESAKRKKERFSMTLQRHIAQPAAVARYTRLMSDIESRFSRHVTRAIAEAKSEKDVDTTIQDEVVQPCVENHSTKEAEITSALVDGGLYYLAGNCHLAWDND